MIMQKSIMILKTLRIFQMPSIYAFSDIYKVPYNINKQQHKDYLIKVQKAEQTLADHANSNLIPRRKRRVYDQPKHDLNITNYNAWRITDYDQFMPKLSQNGLPVVTKIKLQPFWLIHAFGVPSPPLTRYKAAGDQYVFEDNNLSQFILYQYRQTTNYKQNDPNYDYANQQKIQQRKRLKYRLSYEDFWKSQQYFEFRLNASSYAEHLKFKKWILERVEKKKSEESYDEYIDKKFGKSFTFNNKEEAELFVKKQPMIRNVVPEMFTEVKKTETKSKKSDKKKLTEEKEVLSQTIKFAKKLDEIYRVGKKQTEKSHVLLS